MNAGRAGSPSGAAAGDDLHALLARLDLLHVHPGDLDAAVRVLLDVDAALAARGASGEKVAEGLQVDLDKRDLSTEVPPAAADITKPGQVARRLATDESKAAANNNQRFSDGSDASRSVPLRRQPAAATTLGGVSIQ